MRFASTRGGDAVTLDEALLAGIAPDGGLYLPAALPSLSADDFTMCESITDVARGLLAPFFAGSPLAAAVDGIVDETFSFPIPCTPLAGTGERAYLLELFHGPTAAFKDVGAGFLAACLSRICRDREDDLTILVATSGDTGGAVAAAFDGRPGIRVAVLFPDGRVSERQEHQLTCWGDNVLSLAVDGAFDDCQALVKAAFADDTLAAKFTFSSANSINIGRLLPQATYYADASLRHYRATGEKPGFIVPTGNLGNALACILAKDMGLPIGDIVLALNANRLIADYLGGAAWEPRTGIATLASAMDVGNPSNMERLRALHGDGAALRETVGVSVAGDEQIEAAIRHAHANFGIAVCPHTATALHAWRQLSDERREGSDWILVATAHAAKFEAIVEPLIGAPVPLPPELDAILSRPSSKRRIPPTLDALGDALATGFRVDAAAADGDK